MLLNFATANETEAHLRKPLSQEFFESCLFSSVGQSTVSYTHLTLPTT